MKTGTIETLTFPTRNIGYPALGSKLTGKRTFGKQFKNVTHKMSQTDIFNFRSISFSPLIIKIDNYTAISLYLFRGFYSVLRYRYYPFQYKPSHGEEYGN